MPVHCFFEAECEYVCNVLQGLQMGLFDLEETLTPIFRKKLFVCLFFFLPLRRGAEGGELFKAVNRGSRS